jgi:hypothetical protein
MQHNNIANIGSIGNIGNIGNKSLRYIENMQELPRWMSTASTSKRTLRLSVVSSKWVFYCMNDAAWLECALGFPASGCFIA